MIFNFLKYIKPVWYFNLPAAAHHSYFPSPAVLKQKGFHYSADTRYKSNEAQERDIAWRAFQEGIILNEKGLGTDIWKKVKLPLHDEYVFTRKNFNAAWSVYILIFRIITFNNPIREIHAFAKAKKIKRQPIEKYNQSGTAFEQYTGTLAASAPLVSVIIPTLNRYQYLDDVLRDLEAQTYQNFEVIVVDQSENFQEDFYKNRKLDLHYWHQEEKALWLARNTAIESAKGAWILLYDDDSRVEKDWIEKHLKCIDYFEADISSGVSISVHGAKIPLHYSFFRWSDQIDTGNVLMKKEIFRKTGLFDRQFEKQRMGDGEFGLRAYLHGYKNISNPYAKRIHLKVPEGGLRQMGSWDGWRPKKFFAPRPVPSVLYYFRKYFGSSASLRQVMVSVLPSVVPYRFKKNRSMMLLGGFAALLMFPLIMVSVGRSWYLSGKKLKQGALIPQFEK